MSRIEKVIAIYSFFAIVIFIAGSVFGVHERFNDRLSSETKKLSAQVAAALHQQKIEPEAPVVQPIQNPGTLEARAAIVYDITHNVVLYEKNSDEKLPLASVTKLMTALLASEQDGQDSHVFISKDALLTEGDSTLLSNEDWLLKDLTDFMLITSSNDAAVAIAKHIGRSLAKEDEGPRAAFIRTMNERAQGLGLTRTEFFDESGLDTSAAQAGAYGSARDIAKLLAHIVKRKPELIEATIQPYKNITSATGITHAARNTNEAIPSIPALIGGKTGYTDLAGGNLAIVFDRSINEPVAVVVLGSTKDARFTDVQALVHASLNK